MSSSRLRIAVRCGLAASVLGLVAAVPVGAAAVAPAEPPAVAVPVSASAVCRFAADELARHLELVFGRPPTVRSEPAVAAGTDAAPTPGGWRFHVGRAAPGDRRAIVPGEARYEIRPGDVYLYGGDSPDAPAPDASQAAADSPGCRPGTLFAVYDFLERECGIRWLAPGEASTVRLRSGLPELRPCRYRRLPGAAPVGVVLGGWEWATLEPLLSGVPEPFRVTRAEAEVRAAAERLWLRRQRLPAGVPAGGAAGGPRGIAIEDGGLPLGCAAEVDAAVRAAVARSGPGAVLELACPAWGLSAATYGGALAGLARPWVSFDEAEADACAAYGAAALDAKQYLRYWRRPAGGAAAAGADDDGLRAVYDRLASRCPLSELRQAVAFLHDGLTRSLSPAEKFRLQRLLLAHEHAELTVAALGAWGAGTEATGALKQAVANSRRLLEFRRLFAADLGICLPRLLARERLADDATGWVRAEAFDDVEPCQRLPLTWKFRLDPDARGLAAKWYEQPWAELETWGDLRVDRSWDRQSVAAAGDGVSLALYNGSGWYATTVQLPPEIRSRQVFLHVGALEDACSVYVDGGLAGESPAPAGPWPQAVRVRIDPALKWQADQLVHVVVVAVRDGGGTGGLRHPVWISLGRKPEAATGSVADPVAKP